MINTICKIMTISRSGYFKFKKEKRPVVSLLETYFSEDELNEFLSTGKIRKQDLIKEYSFESLSEQLIENKENNKCLDLLVDNALYTLDRKFKNFQEYSFLVFKFKDFFKSFPINILIRIIEKIKVEEDYDEFTAKKLILSKLKSYNTSLKRLEDPKHVEHMSDFIKNELSNIESFILINNMERYLKSGK